MPPKNRGRPGFDLTGTPTAPQSSASPEEEEEEPLDLSPKKIYCHNCGWRDSHRNSSFCAQCPVVLKDPVLNLSLDMEPNLSQTTAEPTWDIPPQLPSPDAIDLGYSSFSFPPSLEASQSVFQTPEPDVVSPGSLLCRFCQETFALPILLHHHVKERHRHPCKMCCRIFKNDMLLIRHQINTHSLALPCHPRPAKRGPGRPKGVAHMLLKPYTRPKPTHVCQACSREFWSPGVLHKHKCNPRLVQCTTCGGYFGSHHLFCKHKSQNLCSNAWTAIGKAMAQAAYAAAQAAHRANSTNPQRESSGATFQILEINFTTPHHHSDSSLHSSNEGEELQSMDRSGAESPSA